MCIACADLAGVLRTPPEDYDSLWVILGIVNGFSGTTACFFVFALKLYVLQSFCHGSLNATWTAMDDVIGEGKNIANLSWN